jgi:hypothetical protein
MSANRQFASLVVAVAVVILNLAAGSAFATPKVDPVRYSPRSVAVANVSSASHDAYYAVKEQQTERAAGSGDLAARHAQKRTRVSTSSAQLNRYFEFKQKQAERIMNGE